MKVKIKRRMLTEELVGKATLLLIGILLVCSQIGYATPNTSENQEKITITGKVVDSNGETIVGANVLIKGTTTGVVTDVNGNYSIQANQGDVLAFSFVGMVSQEVVVGTSNTINITLATETTDIDELVVVGYGTQKKVNLTGAVAAVQAEKLSNRPMTNVSTALQGLLPGVVIIQNSGQPGKDFASISIRGTGTLNNGSPMIVVDGVESTMNDIDPNDIENVSVLKDAASASIYGTRAANGVILITTKKGKNSPMKLSYSGYMGKQKPTRLPEYFESAEYAEITNEARVNMGLTPTYTAQQIQLFRDGSDPDNYANTNWQNLLYAGSGLQQSHYLDISGGTDKTQYMVSLGHLSQDGIIKLASDKRYNFRTNFNTQIYKNLHFGFNLSYSLSNVVEPTNPYTGDMAQIFRQVNRISPMVPYKYSDGLYGYINDGNPIAWMDLGATNNSKYNRGLANIFAEFEPFKGLKLKGNLGYTNTLDQGSMFVKDIQFYSFATKQPTLYQGPNYQRDYFGYDHTITLQSILEYSKTIANHSFVILTGYSQELSRSDYTQGVRKSFLNNELYELNAGSTVGQSVEGSASEIAMQSYFGRLSYNFKDRYLFEANYRFDGSSRFGKDYRFGFFPSFSVGWRVSEESFLKDNSYISNLKVRGSWGKLGNDNIGTYPSISAISLGQNYNFNNDVAAGAAATSAGNDQLRWEATEILDAGLDIGMFQNSLTLSADYFIKKAQDILMTLPLPATFGLSAPYQNAGKVENKGFEFQLGYKGKSGDFNYDVSFNTSFIDNKVTDLKGIDPIVNGIWFKKVGYPVNSFYGYEAEGIFNTQEEVNGHATQATGTGPGDIKYKDQNGDGVIDGDDRVYLGSPDPGIIYGLTISANWKGFDLSVFFQGVGDVKGYLQIEAIGEIGGNTSKPSSLWRDRWTPENLSQKFPRALLSSRTQNSASKNPSSFWVLNGSYVRLKNIQLGYTIPKKVTNKIGIDRIRIYYSGQNILTLTKFKNKGFDPEAPAGSRGNYYPQVMVHTIGVNINF
ncbi:MAG: TonB-dependent receptor [Bacteroidales bacterium]|nr:MAG: TonB-dependent receptor [Bacteroidales bacterium]